MYRRLDAVFETLSMLAEADRGSAFGFALAALMHGLDRREQKK